MRFSPPPAPGTALLPSLFFSHIFLSKKKKKTADGGGRGGVVGRVGWVADVDAGVILEQAYNRNVSLCVCVCGGDTGQCPDGRRLAEEFFFLLPPQQPPTKTPASS